MEDLGNLDDLELNVDERSENKTAKRYVQVFGWITFGLGIIYLLVSFIRLVMMSFMNAVSDLASRQTDAFDFFDQFIAYQKLLAIIAIILSGLFILGGLSYALRKEWGRKIYIVVCILGIGYHLFSGYITFFMMSDMNDSFQNSRNNMGPFSPGFSSITWFFTSLIPIAYLVINIIIAGKPNTKALMK